LAFLCFPQLSSSFPSSEPSSGFFPLLRPFRLSSIHRCPWRTGFLLGEPELISGTQRAFVIHSFLPGLRRRMNGRSDGLGGLGSADSDSVVSADCFPIYVLRQQTKRTLVEICGVYNLLEILTGSHLLIDLTRDASFLFLSFLVLCYLSVPSASVYSSFSHRGEASLSICTTLDGNTLVETAENSSLL